MSTNTVEGTHGKIIRKINLVKTILDEISQIVKTIMVVLQDKTRKGNKYKQFITLLESTQINLMVDYIETIENTYTLSVVSTLSDYYQNKKNESYHTKEYHRIITSENIIGKINDILWQSEEMITKINNILCDRVMSKEQTKVIVGDIISISKQISSAKGISIVVALEKRIIEICTCGSRMDVVPELSELHCPNCSEIKTIVGAVFRDDQFYPQDGQKTKHGGYDTSRHYKFWIERLQALETKVFDEDVLANIAYIIKRDNYHTRELTCELMRAILKNPRVKATNLNDHAPLLVKKFGGEGPPQLDYHENRLCAIRFNKVIALYDKVNPTGGNKPYYPYFIYKILEEMFKGNPAKLRLLDYIHLQSRETVVKNDNYYKQMCELSDDVGLVYRPTDPAGRV